MKITGKILTQKTMAEMKVGESGFLDKKAILLINRNQILINANYPVSIYATENCVLPITRTGAGPEDYEISVYTTHVFFSSILAQEEIESFKSTYKVIGPFDIEIEIEDSSQCCQQLYPRMTWQELIDEFGVFNEQLINGIIEPDIEAIFLENKQQIIPHMIQCIDSMSLETLECYRDMFKPMDNEDDSVFNRYEDKEIDIFINSRIKFLKRQQTLEEKSIDDLEILQQQYIAQERFEDAERIKQIINTKKIQQTQ